MAFYVINARTKGTPADSNRSPEFQDSNLINL
nr:MAG TPA: hypothetical protein [Caudoviricetes sp.]